MPLKPAVSSLARQTIKTAYDQLDQTILPEDSWNFNGATLHSVRTTALAIEEQLSSRRSLRNMRRLLPLFAGLEHYSNVMDILCNGTPYLSWIWAPITLVLRIASEYVEAFEKLVRGYSRIADSLTRFKLLHESLSASPDFQQTLAVFYADILQFHKHAYAFVRRKSWRLLFLTSWGRFQRRFDNILDDMKRHEELIDLQANAHGISDIRHMREEIKSWREESIDQVQASTSKEAHKQYESIIAWLKAEDSDQVAILDSISAEGAKFAGTCSWALKNSKIKSWLGRQADSPLLWLQGTPGSGKSVLASQIVRFMKTANMFLIHHFCTQRYAASTTYEQLLRSILLQLLLKDEELTALVYQEYVLGKREPTMKALEKLIRTLFSIASHGPRETEHIWIIIDGLNECEPRPQINVVNLVNRITSRVSGAGGTVCKVLICSRVSLQITNKLKSKKVVSLSEEKNSLQLAIRQYVSQRLRSMQEKLRQFDLKRKEIDEIERAITNKTDGMFLYARLVLDYLSKNIFYSGEEMKSSIDELPKELSEFYQKILLQIFVQLDNRSVNRIKCIFSWIAFAKRPLKRMEFLSALTFSAGEPRVTKLVPKYVLDMCGALLEEKPDTTLAFIHISVKEFLQSPLNQSPIINEKDAILEQCISTLACLMSGIDVFLKHETELAQALRVVKGIHGFHVYATEFWTEYLLHHLATYPHEDSSRALQLGTKLADILNELHGGALEQGNNMQSQSVDERIKYLDNWPRLQRLVERSLRARSLDKLESSLVHEIQSTTESLYIVRRPTPSPGLPENDFISSMLSSYQSVVRYLLEQTELLGVSADDLAFFKGQFQSSAFTCRLSFCPRATIGFPSEELRQQHEIAHTRLVLCTVPECQYPPLSSIRALRSHISKYHCPEKKRRPIRRMGNLPQKKAGGIEKDASENPEHRTPPEVLAETAELPPSEHNATTNEPLMEIDDQPSMATSDDQIREPCPFRKEEQILGLDEMIQADISSMGYRACGIAECGMRLFEESGSDEKDQNSHNSVSFHYWHYHHADSMARCAANQCQMTFIDFAGLQAHYEGRHITMLCKRCDAGRPYGFEFESELRHHWQARHMRRVKQWLCGDFEQSQEPEWAQTLLSWESCAEGHKFDNRDDAIQHLESRHGIHLPVTQQSLVEKFVKEVWVYETMDESTRMRNITGDGKISGEDEPHTVDDMFYVKDLYDEPVSSGSEQEGESDEQDSDGESGWHK